MSKYDPLKAFLAAQVTGELPMTFAEIESVLGCRLPDSKQYPAWWSNNPSNNVMTRAWLAAGYRTERVDIAGERLVFCRQPDAKRRMSTPQKLQLGVQETARPFGKGFFAQLREGMEGSVTIAPGVDLTEPTGVVWDAMK